MLDPRWKEEKKQADLNRAASAVMPGGTDVSASIRAIAAHRPDIFGENIGEAEKQRQAAELAKSRAREKNVWDGHAASKETTTMRYQQTANYDDQIAALHRAKGLLPTEESNIGPTMPEPSEMPETVVEAPTPAMTTLTTGASISAAPQPPQVILERTTSSNFATSVGPPPGFAPQDVPASGSPMPAPPLPAGLPQRPSVSTPGEGLPTDNAAGLAPPAPTPTAADAQQSGVSPNGTRPAPDEAEDEPSAKRARRDEGHIVPEEEWLAKHPDPVKITVQLPEYPAKPAWGCKGQAVELEVPLTLLIGTVRDRIAVSFFLLYILSRRLSCSLTQHLTRHVTGYGWCAGWQTAIYLQGPPSRKLVHARCTQPGQRRHSEPADQGQEVESGLPLVLVT